MEVKPITPEEFESRMKKIKEDYYDKMGDIEIAHRLADDLMTEVLNSLGYSEGLAVNKSMKKWWA